MSLFDTHCHLDDPRLGGDLDGVLERAAEAGVRAMTAIGCASSVETIGSALEVARQHPGRLYATAGVHPHDASAYDDALEGALMETGRDPQIVAVGEMGLDYYYDNSPREAQQTVFRRQIAVAKALGKPLVVHTRDAAEDTLRILREEDARDVGGIIHCFSEGPEFARAALELGFVASFSGIVTFKSATAIREAARLQPLDALLVETDAPYLAPVPHRGKRNEPAFVAHTARVVADLRGMSYEALLEATWANAHRVFRLDAASPAESA
jgi:TatD DNase family protein